MSNNQAGYFGERPESAPNSEYSALTFLMRQVLSGHNSAALVEVVAVDAGLGALSPIGRVDVKPMVNQLDGQGNAVPHGVISSLIYFRLQGGANAVIIDPEVGDTGLAVFCDRDISSAVATGAAANPGSMRRNDMADGIYYSAPLTTVPEQYARFSEDGIEIVSPSIVRTVAPSVRITATAVVIIDSPNVSVSGNLSVGGGATGTFSTPQGTIVTVKDGIITNIT